MLDISRPTAREVHDLHRRGAPDTVFTVRTYGTGQLYDPRLVRIRCLRTLHAVSQDRLADKAQVSRVTLGSIERGEHAANVLTYRKLAEALVIDTGDLLTDKDFPWPTPLKT